MSAIAKLRAKAAATTSTKKSTDKPSVILQGELAQAATQWREHMEQIDGHDALAKQCKAMLDDHAMEAIRASSRAQGKVVSSVELIAGPVVLTYSVKNMYSPIPGDKGEYMQSVFGERAAQYFIAKDEVSIKASSLADEKFVEELLARLGEDFFDKHFDVKNSLKVSEAFHTDYLCDDQLYQRAKDVPAIRPYAGSIRR